MFPRVVFSGGRGILERRTRRGALHVLFVCTGNICRSPIAERLAVAHADQLQIPDFTARSAGTRAVIGHKMHNDAELVLQSLGGSASNFAARQLSQRIAAQADLILTMTRAHRDWVLEMTPNKLNTTFTLCEASRLAVEYGAKTFAELPALRSQLVAGSYLDIEDPIGKSAEIFTAVGTQIADVLPAVMGMCQRSVVATPRERHDG